MEPVLRLSEVSFRHKIRDHSTWKPWAFRDGPGIHSIDLDILPGNILGVIGPNGAGKTTLLRVISGIYNNDGEISRSASTRRRHIGHMPEQVRWEGKSSVQTTLEMFAQMHGNIDEVKPLLSIVGLSAKCDTPLDNLSQGMRQRLSLACALLGEPKILVLDEPLNGLDPIAQRAFCTMLKKIAEKGVSVIISSHQVAGMIDLVDRIALLHQGQLLIEGSIDSIQKTLGLDGFLQISGTNWSEEVKMSAEEALEKYKEKGITSLTPKPVDLVELICAATGINPDEVGFELSSDDMSPFKRLEVEEE
jgi:ABC-2 type transport system ATP-binding protein